MMRPTPEATRDLAKDRASRSASEWAIRSGGLLVTSDSGAGLELMFVYLNWA
jgi:hypothetical protein